MIYGGMDPGNKGAIVAMDHNRETVYQSDIPLLNIGKGKKNKWVIDPVGLMNRLRDVRDLAAERGERLFFVLEKAQTMAPGGGGRSPASPRSMFQYGRGYGMMEMALIALEIPHETIHPRTWGSKILKGVEGKDTKARAILRIQRAVPSLDLTPGRKRVPQDGLADAGCMCLYGMTLHSILIPVAPAPGPVTGLPPGPPTRLPGTADRR